MTEISSSKGAEIEAAVSIDGPSAAPSPRKTLQPTPSPRKSSLAPPRSSPRSFAEKRAFFGKIQQHRQLQKKLESKMMHRSTDPARSSENERLVDENRPGLKLDPTTQEADEISTENAGKEPSTKAVAIAGAKEVPADKPLPLMPQASPPRPLPSSLSFDKSSPINDQVKKLQKTNESLHTEQMVALQSSNRTEENGTSCNKMLGSFKHSSSHASANHTLPFDNANKTNGAYNSNTLQSNHLDTISMQNIFIPKDPRDNHEGNLSQTISSFEEEFSEVFQGEVKTIYSSDLTKRVLDRASVFQTQKREDAAGTASGVARTDSFDRDSIFVTNSFNRPDGNEEAAFGNAESFESGSLEKSVGVCGGGSHAGVPMWGESSSVISNEKDNQISSLAENCLQVEQSGYLEANEGTNDDPEEQAAQINLFEGGIAATVLDSDAPTPNPCAVSNVQEVISESTSLEHAFTLSAGDTNVMSENTSLLAKRRLRQKIKNSEKTADSNRTEEVQQEKFENDDNSNHTGDDKNLELSNLSIESCSSVEEERPRVSPVDPKLKRRHKMACRLASGKINVPKSLLSAAATGANVVASLEGDTKIIIDKEDSRHSAPMPSSPAKSPTMQEETSVVFEALQVDAGTVAKLNDIGGDSDLELSNLSIESSASDARDGPRSSPVDPKLKRRHKMATRVASGKVNVPKSFLYAAATSANVVAGLEHDTKIVVAKEDSTLRNPMPSSPTKSPMMQQETTEVFEALQVDADTVVKLNDISGESELELSNLSIESSEVDAADGPRSSPVDPKLKRRHKMATRVASGKVNVPKSFLSAAATSANVVAGLENGLKIPSAKQPAKPTIGLVEPYPIEVKAMELNCLQPVTSLACSPTKTSDNHEEVVEPISMSNTLFTMQPKSVVDISNIQPSNNFRSNITAIAREQCVELHISSNELHRSSHGSNNLPQSCDSATRHGTSPPSVDCLPTSSSTCDPSDDTIEIVADEIVDILNTSEHFGKDFNTSRELDKNEARRQRRQLRKRDMHNAKSSAEEKNSKDLLGIASDGKCFGSVDEHEAKTLFPLPSFGDTSMISSLQGGKPISNRLDPWDENAVSGLDTNVKKSKNCNKNGGKEDGGTPLLELNAVSSDATGGAAGMALEKLLLQHERMTMYTSGKGFGVGDDSSVELAHDSENEVDDNFVRPCEYQKVDDENDALEAVFAGQDVETFDFIDFGKGSHEEFSAAESSAIQTIDKVREQLTGVISDTGMSSDFFNDTNSSTTGGGTVLGLRFIGSNDDSFRSRPTPPGSPADLMILDVTPRAGTKDYNGRLEVVKEWKPTDKPKLFKIAPPPPEKIRKWEESKRGQTVFKPPAINEYKTTVINKETSDQDTPKQGHHVLTANDTPPSVGHEKALSLKISTPKSPIKKKPHSISDELNLSSHTKMAEKFAIASFKAAKKFEEKYSHIEHDIQYGPQAKSPERIGGKTTKTNTSRFFCAGDSGLPFIPGGNPKETETVNSPQYGHTTATGTAGPGVVELVGGAFSPWKIPDRAEEESNASLSRVMYDDESYAKASAAALNTIRVNSEVDPSTLTSDGPNKSTELFEVSLEWADGDVSSFDAGGGVEDESLLSDVLVWLFDEVLPSNAFSAFDINTSTSVQAARVLAIAKDDKSLNLICQHVTSMVMKQHGYKLGIAEKQNDFVTEVMNASSSGDLLTSTCESSHMTTIVSSISESKSSVTERSSVRILNGKRTGTIESFSIPDSSHGGDVRLRGEMLAANFISFLEQISSMTGVPLPFDENPFQQSVLNSTTKMREHTKQERKSMQELVFDREESVVNIFTFLKNASGCESHKRSITSIVETVDDGDDNIAKRSQHSPPEWRESLGDAALQARLASGSQTLRRSNKRKNPNQAIATNNYQNKQSSHLRPNRNLIVPKTSPSPFETALWNDPSIMLSILSFLGNPVSVCVVKRLNVFCNRLVSENEHVLMRDAVRLGGMSKFVRPSFWLWVTIERCTPEDPIPLPPSRRGHDQSFSFHSGEKKQRRDFSSLKDLGAAGKWQHIIERDVLRAFGNMPPHKTGAKYRQDSIVRALVSFGKEEIMRNSRSYQAMDKLPEESEAQHFKLSSRLDRCNDCASEDSSETPTDTVSDWGGISPVGSMVSEEPSAGTSDDGPINTNDTAQLLEIKPKTLKLNSTHTSKSDVCDPVLSGNALTNEMKVDLQNKLRSILHALAAQHEGLGYCQGMDYIVAHLLRVLQDTILLRVIQGSMPILGGGCAHGDAISMDEWRTMPTEQLRSKMNAINSETVVVEEVVFRVMDTFFTTYNLQHMYWPELRCLKTCCRVFESLIKQKLPVLADHFEHHDLNVGLFALGWFQTLFLYLPSMPSATVCHMWDIWLVERSFKIFFRVGTAILFLSQPTLLNHDLEGMMTYLNTFPDATLLRRDILIPCALQIKITNRMLVEIEMDVTNFRNKPHDNAGGDHYNMY
ncbi:hypothetical protein HJC23_002916 [Cyclotella cryptica]|uniref:Rab-GAP TBC domain-containing protein n=1 Tax=Cyclotella cryptica TaxID=29204 RepID=A0ABD3PVL6_9STRA